MKNNEFRERFYKSLREAFGDFEEISEPEAEVGECVFDIGDTEIDSEFFDEFFADADRDEEENPIDEIFDIGDTEAGAEASGAVLSEETADEPTDEFSPIEKIFEWMERKIRNMEQTSDESAESCRESDSGESTCCESPEEEIGCLRYLFEQIPLVWIGRGLCAAAREAEEEEAAGEQSSPRLRPTLVAMVVCLLILGGVAYYILCAHDLRAMASVEQLEVSANAYTMTYSGNYGFDRFLEQGGASSDRELVEFLEKQFSGGLRSMPFIDDDVVSGKDGFLTVRNSVRLNGSITGRSFNCAEELMAMVVITRPDRGRDTVSAVNLNWLGYSPYSRPDLFNRYASLAAIYLPLDGMNDCGLTVAALEVSDEPQARKDTDRTDLTVTTALRLLLDAATDVDHAVALLEQYDVFPTCGREHHLAISDRWGNSVIVEWVDGDMIVSESACAANGYVSTQGLEQIPEGQNSVRRMESLTGTYSKYDGYMTEKQVINAMKYAAPDGDGWMAIYDTHNTSAVFCFDGDYDRQFSVCLN